MFGYCNVERWQEGNNNNNMMMSSKRNVFRFTGHLCGEFTGHRWIPAQRPVTRSFDVFFYLRLNKRLSKQSWGWWFETPSCPYLRHNNESCSHIQHITRSTLSFWLRHDEDRCTFSRLTHIVPFDLISIRAFLSCYYCIHVSLYMSTYLRKTILTPLVPNPHYKPESKQMPCDGDIVIQRRIYSAVDVCYTHHRWYVCKGSPAHLGVLFPAMCLT